MSSYVVQYTPLSGLGQPETTEMRQVRGSHDDTAVADVSVMYASYYPCV